ncbi:conserved hypothetical protein [delta proteobacterium NaphS2]|nr:conserved hypothetical protein [delta proteobacterium NaphS2]
MKQDPAKDFCESKLQLLWRTGNELANVFRSHEIAVLKKENVLPEISERFEVIRRVRPDLSNPFKKIGGDLKKWRFSNYKNVFEKLGEEKDDITRDILIKVIKSTHYWLEEHLEIVNRPDMRSHFLNDFEPLLDPEFKFSDDFETFSEEFYGVFWLTFCLEDNNEPRINLATMKALLQAGKTIEQLNHEGEKSDSVKHASEADRKGYIDKQIYFELLYSDKFEALGKSRHATAERIRKEALKREQDRVEKKNKREKEINPKAKGEKPRKVHSNKVIRDHLASYLDKHFP